MGHHWRGPLPNSLVACCVKDILILVPTPTHQQYVHHRTCTMTSCINALPLSHSIIQQSLQINRERKKCGLEARHLGQ